MKDKHVSETTKTTLEHIKKYTDYTSEYFEELKLSIDILEFLIQNNANSKLLKHAIKFLYTDPLENAINTVWENFDVICAEFGIEEVKNVD